MSTIFEKIGGHGSVVALIDLFYTKVLASPITGPMFQGVNVDHTKNMQVELFSSALGSGTPYTGKSMVQAHTGLNITKEQFDAVAQYLHESLGELGVDEESTGVIMNYAASMEGKVVGR